MASHPAHNNITSKTSPISPSSSPPVQKHLDLESIRQYELYQLNERKLSSESVNTFVSSVQFLYQVTLEMPWGWECFPASGPTKLPVVLSPHEVELFFEQIYYLMHRAALMTC